MKTESRDPLLETVMEDEEIFRAAMLRQTLALARRRRRGRAVRRALGGAVMLILAVAWLHRETPPPPAPQPLAKAGPVRIIRSAPLASNELVSTRRGLFTSIASAPAGIQTVGSRADAFAAVETRSDVPMLHHLDDQQLLAVFHDEHPALIARGTAEARLVFY
jgi:hypothetical protein